MEKSGRISWNETLGHWMITESRNLRRTAEKGILFVTVLKKKALFFYEI
jgi:hypothetical protein